LSEAGKKPVKASEAKGRYLRYFTYGAKKAILRLFFAKLGERAIESEVVMAAATGKTKYGS